MMRIILGVRLGSEHLTTRARTSYQDYLRQQLPYRPREIRVPPYAPDEPRTRRPPKQPHAEPPDLVDISAEVDAFAYLIASKTLTPPLAIGLFGEWGSGKSYFLRSLQRRIDQLVTTAEVANPPYHRAIAQVEFNAWQYVEGNLWASLLEHLFRNLRLAGEEDKDDLLATRRSEYLKQITERTAEHRKAVQQRDELAEQRKQAHQDVQHKRDERDAKLAELEHARQRNPFAAWKPSREFENTLDEVKQKTGLGGLEQRADELRHTLASTSDTVRRAGPVLGALRAGGWPYVVALIVVIALGPAASLLLSWLDASAVSNVIGSLSAVLAGVTAYAARGTSMVSGALDTIAKAQAQLDAELDACREQLDEQIRDAESALAHTERALASAVDKEQQLAASVAELETELARITPSSVLAEFLGQRSTSDAYRQHLGVPALVRQDLERLSRLIQQRHESPDSGDPPIPDQHAIDRVVLYIDDLDRCPTHLVIKVLEAVHLLLAYPLFVVVVAVDARWLESSLCEHYAQLNADAAVPADYLEKIFQVPFWIWPLGVSVRRRMVRDLLTLDPATDATDATNVTDAGRRVDPAGAPTRVPVSEADLPYFTQLVESFGDTTAAEPPWLETATLTVSGPELALIEDIAPLIAATPRAVKRFVNVYLLLRSVGRGRGWPLPEQGQVALLLAVATGLPDLAGRLLPRIATLEPDQPMTLHAVLDTLDPVAGKLSPAAVAQLTRLQAWLTNHPAWTDVPLADMDHWVELTVRFRFGHGPPTDAQP